MRERVKNMKFMGRWLSPLLTLGDLILVAAAYGSAYYLRFITTRMGNVDPRWVDPLHYWYAAPLVLLVFWVTFKWLGLYRGRGALSVVDEFSALAWGVIVALLILGALAFFYRDFQYSTKVFGMTGLLAFTGLLLWRTLMRWWHLRLRRKGIGVVQTLLAGSGPTAQRIAARLKANPGLGYRLKGFVDDLTPAKAKSTAKTLGLPYLGRLNTLSAAAHKAQVHCVLVALPASLASKTPGLVLEVAALGLDLRIVSDLFGVITSPLAVDDIHGIPVFALKEAPLDRLHNRFMKRCFDLALVLPGLLLLSPLLLLLAVLVKVSSKGPIFYTQDRVGLDNRHFKMLKFRSMRTDAEAQGPGWTVKDDPRRTKLGTFMRRTSLDELPQIFNVLRGDMSLVGPRPEQPYFVDQFSKNVGRYLQRHSVLPGISGWAQVHGWRGDTSIEERTAFDLYYVENWSLSLDVLILMKTAFELFEHETAY
jgi:putative colanic acid biosynthesis UDP-glucose lipid carrier transferase